MSSPPFTVFPSSLLSLQHVIDSTTDGSEGVLQDGNLVVSRHILSREIELFLEKMSTSAVNREGYKHTNCFFTGRSSSLVVASSMDGLDTLDHQNSNHDLYHQNVPFIG